VDAEFCGRIWQLFRTRIYTSFIVIYFELTIWYHITAMSVSPDGLEVCLHIPTDLRMTLAEHKLPHRSARRPANTFFVAIYMLLIDFDLGLNSMRVKAFQLVMLNFVSEYGWALHQFVQRIRATFGLQLGFLTSIFHLRPLKERVLDDICLFRKVNCLWFLKKAVHFTVLLCLVTQPFVQFFVE